MKNYWNIAFAISLVVHTAIIVRMPSFMIRNNPPELVKINREITILPREIKAIEKLPIVAKETQTEMKPLPFIDNMMDKLMVKPKIATPLKKSQLVEIDETGTVISDQSLDNKLQKNPAYMDYYRLIREKIRATTYRNYDTGQTGEIFLSFLIDSNGALKKVEVGNNSVKNPLLEKIALKSIEEAAPFPVFPAELTQYSQLQFNISIYFKNK